MVMKKTTTIERMFYDIVNVVNMDMKWNSVKRKTLR